MAMFTDQEIAAMTPAEAETARAMNAAEETGKDPFGDDLDDDVDTDETDSEGGTTDEADEQPADAAADDAEDKPADEAPAATDEAPAAAAEEEQPEPEAVLEFKAEAPTDADAKLAELRKQRLDARKKWSAGEIDEEELEALEAPIESAMAEIRQQQAVAAAMEQANRQLQAKQQADAERAARVTINRIRAEGTAAGLDYSAPTDAKPTGGEHAVEFDTQLRALGANPAWANKGFDAIAAEAHRRVMALAGKTVAPAAGRPAPPKAPVTLRDVPGAARANEGSDTLIEQFKAATGLAAEKLWNRMTPAQQERALGD